MLDHARSASGSASPGRRSSRGVLLAAGSSRGFGAGRGFWEVLSILELPGRAPGGPS